MPGDVIFVDFDKNGEINDKDKTMIGKGTPDWTFGLNLNAFLKISTSACCCQVLWAGNHGCNPSSGLPLCDLPAEFMNRWHGEGTSNTMPRFSWANNNDNWRVSDLYVHNGSYARIKNIQLGYTLPSYLTQKIFIQKLRFYVAAENLLTMTSYKGS